MEEFNSTQDLLKMINKDKPEILGNKTDRYVTMASVDIETNSLSHTGDILTFGYSIAKMYYSNDKPNDNATELSQDKFIVGMELFKKEDLYFYYSGLSDVGRTDIHGITMDMMLSHANEFEDNLCKMASICTSYILVTKRGYKFDLPYIFAYLLKNHIVLDEDNLNVLDIECIMSDTWKRATGASPKKTGTLGEYVNWLNNFSADKPFVFKAHNSEEDAYATLWSYYRFMRGEYVI